MRILIIEDEQKIAEVIASRLKKENYVVDTYQDGEGGLDNALTNIYDLIILDVMLPKINGFEILKEIKKDYIEAGDLKLNTKTTTLYCTKTNETIEIICKEFLLLEYLIKNQNQVISKEQIYEKVWGLDNESESNNLEAYISFIRKKLKSIGSETQIKAIRGLGYICF